MAALKGAFLSFGAGLLGVLPNIVVFQFNPTTVTRNPSLPSPPPCDNSGGTDTLQQPCLPGETMSFTLRVDANELLAQSNPIAAASGILPTLSALELLMVPQKSSQNDLLSLAGGGGAAGPFQLPANKLATVLFFWGPLRILPVMITSMTITEMEYDTILNPVRADVSVNLQVLIPTQLAGDAIANGAYDYSLGVKKVMAALNLANAAQFGVSSAISFSI